MFVFGSAAFGAEAAPQYNTRYEKPTVSIVKVGRHIVRLSSRGELRVITIFNSDGTKHSVEDSTGAGKTYVYDGKKHLKEIHRGTFVHGALIENQAPTVISYDMNYRRVIMSTGGVSTTVVFHPAAKNKETNRRAYLPWPPLLPRFSDGNAIAHLRTVQCADPSSADCSGPAPVYGDPSTFFSYYDAYTSADLGNMTVNGQDYQVTATITYGDTVTPIQELANEVIDYLSSPAGETAIAAVAISTMLASPEVAPFVFEAIASSGIFYETVATGLTATAVEATLADATEVGETFQEAVQRGRDFQASVGQFLGAASNTQAFTTTTADNTIIRVIPDFMDAGPTIIEVKDVLTVSYTQQLQGMVNLALSPGVNRPLQLIVSPRTTRITQPLIDAIARTRGSILVYDSSTGATYPYSQP